MLRVLLCCPTGGGHVQDEPFTWLRKGWVDSSTGLHVRITLLLVAMTIIRGIWDHGG